MKPLQRTRKDIILTVLISVVCVVFITAVWVLAPIRGSQLHSAAHPYTPSSPPIHPPAQLSFLWERSDAHLPPAQDSISPKPIVVEGVAIIPHEHGVEGVDPDSGEVLWEYSRQETLCGVGSAWSKVTAIFDAGFGCGDVMQINPLDGTYGASRSAESENPVRLVESNDRVGIIGHSRVELWRNDAVRTIEYGHVPAPQEPKMQPNPECRATSALTRREDLVTIDHCSNSPQPWLRVMGTTPEDSRAPQIKHSFEIPHPQPTLVALGENALSVYSDGHLYSYDFSGHSLGEQSIPPVAPEVLDKPLSLADLPHHMSWYDGHALRLFDPVKLSPVQSFEDARGTGVAIGGRLLYPTDRGIAIANWDTGQIERIIPVDRHGWTGPVSLKVAGDVLVEQRGEVSVGLKMGA